MEGLGMAATVGQPPGGDDSLLDPVRHPESIEESAEHEEQAERRRWEEERPPHYEAR